MRRGEVWTVSGGADYAGKPRPAVIIQDDRFSNTGSIAICPFTSAIDDAAYFRLVVRPSPQNGLRIVCQLMIDKITSLPKSKAGMRIGRLDDDVLLQLNQSLLVFLGLAGTADPVP